MPKPAITTFSSLAVNQSPTNKDNGLYAPELTKEQIDNIPADTLRNGAIVYNTTDNVFQIYENSNWEDINITGGDVEGPEISVVNNIATFNDDTGKVIQDSGVNIAQVPVLLLSQRTNKKFLKAPLVTVNEIGNLGHIRFVNDVGIIFVDGLMPVEFITNDFGPESQVCSLFTGGLPSVSSSPSALVELQTTTGTLLLSRLTQAEINALTLPIPGMVVYNTTTGKLSVYTSTGWMPVFVADASGNLDMQGYKIINLATPTLSTDGANKGYVDAAVSGIPSAIVTLTGNVTGSGVVTSPIVTTLNMTLDQIPIPVSNVNLNNHKIINLLDPTLAQDGATKNYVDTRTIPISQLAGYVSSTATYLRGDGTWANFNTAATALRLDQFAIPTANINLNNNKIINLATPTAATDATNKSYVDSAVSGLNITLTGAVTGTGAGTINTTLTPITTSQISNFTSSVTAFRLDQFAVPTASLSLNSQKIVNLATPTLSTDGANKGYVDAAVSGIPTATVTLTGNVTGSGFVTSPISTTVVSVSPSAINGYPGTTSVFLRGDGNWSNVLSGNLGLQNTIPNAPLQFSNTLTNRKIVFWETANNDHQIYSLGVNSGVFRFQIPDTVTSHVFYAGTSSSTSTELVRITGTGNVGIGTSNPIFPLNIVSGTAGSIKNILTLQSPRSYALATDGLQIIATASNGTLGSHDYGSIIFGNNPSTNNGGAAIARFNLGGNASSTNSTDGTFLYAQNNGANSVNLVQISVGAPSVPIASFSAFANVIISPSGSYELQSNNNINIQSGNLLKFYNSGNTQFAALKAGSLTNSVTWTLPLADGTNGQVLTTNGTGTLSWVSNASSAAKYILQTSDVSLPNAQSLGSLSTGILKNNVSAGTGVLNTAVAGTDYYAPGFPTYIVETVLSTFNFLIGTGVNNTGNGNFAIGSRAFFSNGSGSNNLAIGNQACFSNGDGNLNIGIGLNALYTNVSGRLNLAIGYQSLFSNTGWGNLGIGWLSLFSTTTGQYNIGIGPQALYYNTVGNNNVAIGNSTGGNNNNCNNCVFLGYGAAASINNLTNAIAIGYNAQVSISNALILGNNCNVGIGTSTPNAPLQFASINANRKIVLWEGANNDHQFNGLGINSTIFRFQVNATNNDFVFYAGTSSTTSNEVARITGTGDLVVQGYIYGNRPSGMLYINDNLTTFSSSGGIVQKIPTTTVSAQLNLFTMPVNNRLLYTGARTILASVILSLTAFSDTPTGDIGFGIYIYKNGVFIAGSKQLSLDRRNPGASPPVVAMTSSILTQLSQNDYIEAYIYVASGNITVNQMSLTATAV